MARARKRPTSKKKKKQKGTSDEGKDDAPDHDGGYHALFSHAEMVVDLLNHFLPQDVLQRLDLSKLERVNAKLHATGLQRREGDLIWRIAMREPEKKKRSVYVYLMLEHQSSVDPWMAVRLLVYVGLLCAT